VDPAAPGDPYAPPRADTSVAAGDPEVMTDHEMQVFAGHSGGYYQLVWQRANRTGGSYAGFNWGAALFNHLWMLYRRMYTECAVTVAALVLLPLGHDLLYRATGLRFPGGNLLLVVGAVPVVGFLGNALYLRRAREAVRVARRHTDPRQVEEVLASQGGTNSAALVLGIVAQIIYVVLAKKLRLL
jgi:hypothetical protein